MQYTLVCTWYTLVCFSSTVDVLINAPKKNNNGFWVAHALLKSEKWYLDVDGVLFREERCIQVYRKNYCQLLGGTQLIRE